jgi:hypothetical protein
MFHIFCGFNLCLLVLKHEWYDLNLMTPYIICHIRTDKCTVQNLTHNVLSQITKLQKVFLIIRRKVGPALSRSNRILRLKKIVDRVYRENIFSNFPILNLAFSKFKKGKTSTWQNSVVVALRTFRKLHRSCTKYI